MIAIQRHRNIFNLICQMASHIWRLSNLLPDCLLTPGYSHLNGNSYFISPFLRPYVYHTGIAPSIKRPYLIVYMDVFGSLFALLSFNLSLSPENRDRRKTDTATSAPTGDRPTAELVNSRTGLSAPPPRGRPAGAQLATTNGFGIHWI